LFGPQIERAVSYIGGLEQIVWVIAIAVALFLASRALPTRGARRTSPAPSP
jgi:hypothetical protein